MSPSSSGSGSSSRGAGAGAAARTRPAEQKTVNAIVYFALHRQSTEQNLRDNRLVRNGRVKLLADQCDHHANGKETVQPLSSEAIDMDLDSIFDATGETVMLVSSPGRTTRCMGRNKLLGSFSKSMVPIIQAGCSSREKCILNIPANAFDPASGVYFSKTPAKKARMQDSSAEEGKGMISVQDLLSHEPCTLERLLYQGLPGMIHPLKDYGITRRHIPYFLRDRCIHSISVDLANHGNDDDDYCEENKDEVTKPGSSSSRAASRPAPPAFTNMCGSVFVSGYHPCPQMMPFAATLRSPSSPSSSPSPSAASIDLFTVHGNISMGKHSSGTLVKFKVHEHVGPLSTVPNSCKHVLF